MNEALPKVNEALPKVNEVLPKVNEALPKVNEACSLVCKTRNPGRFTSPVIVHEIFIEDLNNPSRKKF